METVKEIMAQPRQNSRQTWSGEQKEMINKIFATIKVLYPTNAWKGQDESQTKRMCLAHLSKKIADRAHQALVQLFDHHPIFAPTLGGFYKPIGMFVTDFENRERDPLWSDDVEQGNALLVLDLLKDAIGMLERKYEQAHTRFNADLVISKAKRDNDKGG